MDKGYYSEHVYDLGLGTASDGAVWCQAKRTNAAIITKDEDFVTLRLMEVEGPPVVWVRLGNTSKAEILKWFEPLLPIVEKGLKAGEKLIEIA
jgi:predicted nuclease of predicted toxin-antitoxin system